jgi:beta-lactamase superfamily II metal-dependent hydrolase
MANEIDWVVLAGTGDENLAGIAGIVDRFRVRSALVVGGPGGIAYARLVDLLEETACPIVQAQVGQALDLGGGARIEVAAMGGRGSALLLTHGNLRALLAAPAGVTLVDSMVEGRSIGPVTAVLLPGGGAAAVNPEGWLRSLRPRLALISVEPGNRGGLPSAETLSALGGSTVLRTDLNGWIELTSDGEQLWLEVERVPRP